MRIIDDQVGGYEGCRRDYAALAEPITTGLVERAARRVLTVINEDADGQREVCQSTCDFICALDIEIIPDAGCSAGCRAVCNAVPVPPDATKAEVLDAIMNAFIPHIEPQPWARKMIDALAKIPSGIWDGQLMWTGAWDMCNAMDLVHNNYSRSNLTTTVTEQRQFHAKACRIPFRPKLLDNLPIPLPLYLYIAVCVPDTCSNEDIATYLYQDNLLFRVLLGKILRFDIFTEEIYCGHDNDISSDPGMLVCVTIILLLVAIVLVATIYDAYIRPHFITRNVSLDILHLSDGGGVHSSSYVRPAYLAPRVSTSPEGRPAYFHSISTDSTDGRPAYHHSSSTVSTQELIPETEYETIAKEDKLSLGDRLEVLFVGFSGYSNIKRVFRIHRPEGYIECLDFIRFLSFGWVVFAHSWIYGPLLNELWETANLRTALLHYPRQFAFQAVVNFHYAGDTFFLISGLMVAYNWLRRYDDTDEPMTWKSVLSLYARRYWNLMPCMMFMLMIYTTSYKYLINGPLTPFGVSDADHCRDWWWMPLLLIHNFCQLDSTCLVWTWYVACVFQLHVIAPIILIPLVLKRKLGYVLLLVTYLAHIAATAVISAKAVDAETFLGRVDTWLSDYLVTPWCRAGPYLIGIALGDFLHRTNRRCHICGWQKLIGWLVALTCLICPVYGTYTQVYDGADPWTKAEQVAYDTLARSAWALGVAWLILLCATKNERTNNAGYLGDWLNNAMHQPLARMLYPAFLISPLLLFAHVFTQRVVVYISWDAMVRMSVVNVCLSFFFAIFAFILLVHYPIAVGFQRVFYVTTKADCIQAGMYKSPAKKTD